MVLSVMMPSPQKDVTPVTLHVPVVLVMPTPVVPVLKVSISTEPNVNTHVQKVTMLTLLNKPVKNVTHLVEPVLLVIPPPPENVLLVHHLKIVTMVNSVVHKWDYVSLLLLFVTPLTTPSTSLDLPIVLNVQMVLTYMVLLVTIPVHVDIMPMIMVQILVMNVITPVNVVLVLLTLLVLSVMLVITCIMVNVLNNVHKDIIQMKIPDIVKCVMDLVLLVTDLLKTSVILVKIMNISIITLVIYLVLKVLIIPILLLKLVKFVMLDVKPVTMKLIMIVQSVKMDIIIIMVLVYLVLNVNNMKVIIVILKVILVLHVLMLVPLVLETLITVLNVKLQELDFLTVTVQMVSSITEILVSVVLITVPLVW